MTKFELFKALRLHKKLSERRSVAWQQNKAAKILLMIGAGFTIMYLMFFAVIMALAANNSTTVTACELMYGFTPFILLIDFLMRFLMQQTPSQLLKPYSLLPLRKYDCVDCFLATSLLSSGNLIWFAMFIPYAIMSIVFVEGIWVALAFLLGFYLLILINSQWYLLMRTLINQHIAWWGLAIFVYLLLFSLWIINLRIDPMMDTYACFGDRLSHGNLLFFALLVILLVILIAINRRVQYKYTWKELTQSKATKLKHVSRLPFLDRFGETGEYVKLEVKSIMRNKNMRNSFIFANVIVLMLSLIISFTDIYDNRFMNTFWAVYNFAIYGAMILVKVMCNEGNYIDCLIVRKENLISLLRAKYYFYSAMLLIPLILMIPTLIMGKYTLLQLLAVMLFTMGVEYCVFLQMAVYNKQTIPLNTKFIGKGGMENNSMQVVVELLVFFVPIIFIMVATGLFGETGGMLVILAIGLLFIATHRIWIRNIYQRLMKRRYVNFEGFRTSR
ncbi:MAG: hypothetical protein IKX22_05315 [Prevotella sp.]|nr:hypothetical protein [Prevotella sp.]